MPIGVPRIIYCWGEELPAQWTDIYNFIFRRRMVFLMQYLDDELCNQICGLLINIHMEDRSKELERKEMENSGLFSGSNTGKTPSAAFSKNMSSETKNTSMSLQSGEKRSALGSRKERSIEDLMISEEDLAIDENHMLERHTLQKISLEWLNWNAQFFDYSDEPYLFYLAELLSKDVVNNGELLYNFGSNSSSTGPNSAKNLAELEKLMLMFKNMKNTNKKSESSSNPSFFDSDMNSKQAFEVYSAFRLLSNFTMQTPADYKESGISTNLEMKTGYMQQFQQLQKFQNNKLFRSPLSSQSVMENKVGNNSPMSNIVSDFAQKDLFSTLNSSSSQWAESSSEKALAQRQLRRAYSKEKFAVKNNTKLSNYLNLDSGSLANRDEAYMEYRDYYRKQTERTLQEEESKKVFMIINSFGGSVGNGITVHDALQFIKAGSMTLALGVAASAASLALAGGTIGERYVTEGCHTMIHQPESAISGQASDIWIDSQEIMKIRLDVAEIYSLSTYRPRHKILRDLDRDFYLTATETVYYGLADEIATNEVMHEIIEMTSKVWDYHDTQQQRLLETRESAAANLDTQTQN